MKGWIYVATMKHAEGVVKVGYSRSDPDERAKELSSGTNAPGKVKIEYAAWVEDPKDFETRVHEWLKDVREEGKEWFKCSVQTAVKAILVSGHILFEDSRTTFADDSSPKYGTTMSGRTEEVEEVLGEGYRQARKANSERQRKANSERQRKENEELKAARNKFNDPPKDTQCAVRNCEGVAIRYSKGGIPYCSQHDKFS